MNATPSMAEIQRATLPSSPGFGRGPAQAQRQSSPTRASPKELSNKSKPAVKGNAGSGDGIFGDVDLQQRLKQGMVEILPNLVLVTSGVLLGFLLTKTSR